MKGQVREKRFDGKMLKKRILNRENIGFLWVLPALILLCVFSLYPMFSAFRHSFTDWDGTTQANFLGFQNYLELLQDKLFWRSMGNVVLITIISMLIGNGAAILLAELMYNLKSKVANFYRFCFVLPAMAPSIIVLLLWQRLILSGASTSVANTILRFFGLGQVGWFTDQNTAIVYISIFLFGFPWMGGTSFLIYLAGLNAIDPSIIEASRLDGLGAFRRIFLIDLPMIRGQLKYFIVMGFIGGLQNYSIQYAITFGGPGEVINSMQSGTIVPGYYIYRLINGSSRVGPYGYACAMGMVMFLIILVITIINNKFIKSQDSDF